MKNNRDESNWIKDARAELAAVWQAFEQRGGRSQKPPSSKPKPSPAVAYPKGRWTVLCALFLAVLTLPAWAGQSVKLVWDANPETDLSGYILYWGNATRSYHSVTNVGNVTSFTLGPLAEGTNWFFALTARNIAGLESDFSNEVTNNIPLRPSTPLGLTNWLVVPIHLDVTVRLIEERPNPRPPASR